jgi:hypothetical protein
MTYATITWLGGNMPVQAEGTLAGGKQFYFRARYVAWEFSVGATDDDALSAPEWYWAESFGDRVYEASYLPEQTARAIIESCAEMWSSEVAPPVQYRGVPDDERTARSLARILLADVAMYSGEADAAGRRAAVAEARAVFLERTDPRFLHLFDAAFAHLDATLRGEAYLDAWLFDAASARSVARRWVAMLERMPAAERTELSERALRWFALWTAPGAARDAIFNEFRAGGSR